MVSKKIKIDKLRQNTRKKSMKMNEVILTIIIAFLFRGRLQTRRKTFPNILTIVPFFITNMICSNLLKIPLISDK